MQRKVKQYQKMYTVQKLIRIIQQKGQKYVIVKWKNFSYAQNTKQPLEYIRSIPSCLQEVERLEEEYQKKRHSVNFNKIFRQWYSAAQQNKPMSEQSEESRKGKCEKEQEKMGFEEKVAYSQLVYETHLKKVKAGLKGMTAQHYFQLVKLYKRAERNLRNLILFNRVPLTDKVLSKVKGLMRNEEGEGYIYCVIVDSKAYQCSLQEMMEHFPTHLARFLKDFTTYMYNFMTQEIKEHERKLKNRQYMRKGINDIYDALKAEGKVEKHESMKQVCFGVDEEDCLNNQRKAHEKKMYFTNILKQYNEHLQKTEKTEIAKPNTARIKPVESIYNQLMAKIKQAIPQHPQKQIASKKATQKEPNFQEQEYKNDDSSGQQYKSKSIRSSARLKSKSSANKKGSIKMNRSEQVRALREQGEIYTPQAKNKKIKRE